MSGKLAQREHRITKSLQLLTAAKIRQVDNESAGNHRSARDADQPERRFGRAASGNQVVDEQDALAALNCVTVDFQSVCAIFELVIVTEVFGRQLPLLADWYKANVELVSERGTDDKTADSIAAILSIGRPQYAAPSCSTTA